MSATFARARSSLAFKISRLGKKILNRGMKSSPDGNSPNHVKSLAISDKEGRSTQSSKTPLGSFEEEFPPLSVGIHLLPKSKRRTRIDLGAHHEQDLEHEVEKSGPDHLEASTSSTSCLADLCLPTSFGKKPHPSASRSRKLRQTHSGLGGSKKSSKLEQGIQIAEPSDICLPEARESNSLKSSVDGRNYGIWRPKAQPTEEIRQPKHYMEGENEKEQSVHEIGQVLRPGMVLLKKYIPLSKQVEIVKKCRELGIGPGGFYRPGYNDGAKLRLYMMCLGLDWNPQTKQYGERRHHDNAAPPDIPCEFTSLVRRALDDSHTVLQRCLKTINVAEIIPPISPDVCIVNFYTTKGRLGLHQDRDESQESLREGLPVVSVSVGDSAEFLYGDQRDADKAEKVLLESGDVLIFGGESRLVFHGVTTIIPNSAPPALLESSKLRPGRLNLTFRKY